MRNTRPTLTHLSCALCLLLASLPACRPSDTIVVRTPERPTPVPILLLPPEGFGLRALFDAVTDRINATRAKRGLPWLQSDDVLADYASIRAWNIVRGAPLEEIDDAMAAEIGEPVGELRACMSPDVTAPAAVARFAVENWLDDPLLREILLGKWQRLGVGLDWGCPTERGIILIVLFAGAPP